MPPRGLEAAAVPSTMVVRAQPRRATKVICHAVTNLTEPIPPSGVEARTAPTAWWFLDLPEPNRTDQNQTQPASPGLVSSHAAGVDPAPCLHERGFLPVHDTTEHTMTSPFGSNTALHYMASPEQTLHRPDTCHHGRVDRPPCPHDGGFETKQALNEPA